MSATSQVGFVSKNQNRARGYYVITINSYSKPYLNFQFPSHLDFESFFTHVLHNETEITTKIATKHYD